MATEMDALQSFVHLQDSVPSWLSKLDELTIIVAEHNARFLEMARYGSRLLTKKNLSTESLHEGPVQHYAIEGETPAKATGIYVPPNPSHQCVSHASRARNAANNARKRKGSNASVISGQPRYRTKSMVVVYYDSAIQESFETLFRSIAGARNNLRKGKRAATFKARMASLVLDESSNPAAGEISMLNAKTMLAGLGRRSLGPDFAANDKLPMLDEADRDLEITQSLCEVAAHQLLRDGDCRVEIEGMRKKFENCRAIAKREVERLKEEEAREQDGKEIVAKTVEEEQLPVARYIEAKVNSALPLKEMNFTETGVIEIDDHSDAGSVQIDLSAFRTRGRRV